MTSPSVRSTRRSTPWVLGCCGPMLTSISSVRTSNSMTVGSGVPRVTRLVIGSSVTVAIYQSPVPPRAESSRRVLSARLEDSARGGTWLSSPNPVIFQRELVILPQWVPDPILGQQHPPQVRVPREPHPAQVVHLAFVPVGD